MKIIQQYMNNPLRNYNYIVYSEKSKEADDLDFTIELMDSSGNTASTTISKIKKIAPRINVKYIKIDQMNSRFGNKWEATLETFALPWTSFSGMENLSGIAQVKFVFNKTKSGMLIIDEIGVQK